MASRPSTFVAASSKSQDTMIEMLCKEEMALAKRRRVLSKLTPKVESLKGPLHALMQQEAVEAIEMPDGAYVRLYTNKTRPGDIHSWDAADAIQNFAKQDEDTRKRLLAATDIESFLRKKVKRDAAKKRKAEREAQGDNPRARWRRRTETAILQATHTTEGVEVESDSSGIVVTIPQK